jgi:hypothetical protein
MHRHDCQNPWFPKNAGECCSFLQITPTPCITKSPCESNQSLLFAFVCFRRQQDLFLANAVNPKKHQLEERERERNEKEEEEEEKECHKTIGVV